MKNLGGKYVLTSLIRETAQSLLYQGYRQSDGKPIVVKKPRSELPTELELARLRHEHRIISSLSLPCVVRSLGLERAENGLALVLEDVGAASVEVHIAKGEMDLLARTRLAVSLARALEQVHRAGIVHKDIKPEHFFVDIAAPASVKLIDFGLSTELPREVKSFVPATQLEGSLPYIAPEQTGRINRAVDRRSDIYSLGIMLYELFTGERPFDTDDPMELVHSHIARVPRAPRELNGALPRPLSNIVMKLLEKVPEDRYQSAAGLVFDLEWCLEALENTGRIESLSLAANDCSEELRIPQKAYGRQVERERLMQAFERVKAGGAEMILIGGSSGIGKSALVAELRPELVRGGYFAFGKFEYLDRSVPYGALAGACRTLVQAVLAESPDTLQATRQAISEAVGENGQVMVDLVPELELIIGKPAAAPPLGPGESQRRFELVFQKFLHSVSSESRPLVLFLDDLQWADAASLRLVQLALTGGARHLLLLGAYRDHEVDASHPLWLTVEELKGTGSRVEQVHLKPLSKRPISELLVDCLRCELAEVEPLAEVLLRKTDGNPFYLTQLLNDLHRDGLLGLNVERRAWRWDLSAIERASASNNVVDFLLERLRRLDQDSQAALQQAACIGHEFDTLTLSLVAKPSPAEVNEALWSALKEGLLIPLDGNYGLLHGDAADASMLQARYRFLHDRVQQAAYALADAAAQQRMHLTIGRHLLAGTSEEARKARLFDIVDQLNRALTIIDQPDEKRQLAALNLEAGVRARQAAAPRAAISYFEACLQAIDSNWALHHEIVYRAHLGKSECELLVGNIEGAMDLLAAVEAHAGTVLEKVSGRQVRLRALTAMSRLEETCRLAVDTVGLLGVALPNPGDKAALGEAIGAQFGAFQAARADRDVRSLVELAPMKDEIQLALVNTLAAGLPASAQSNQELHVAFVLEGARRTLDYGTAPVSPFFYAQYGIAHLVITGDTKTAFEFGQLALTLSERPEHRATASSVHFLYASFLAPWQVHISETYESCRMAVKLGLDTGDLVYAQYAIALECICSVLNGAPLEEVTRRIEAGFELVARTDDILIRLFLQLAQLAVAELTGSPSGAEAAAGLASFEQTAPPPILAAYGPLRVMTCFLAGDAKEALRVAEAFVPMPAIVYNSDHTLFKALALADLALQASDEERERLVARLQTEARTLDKWADSAPQNHGHRSALIRAELARLRGDIAAAQDAYEAAIDQAQAGGFLVHQAIACERCARLNLSAGHHRAARPYATEAHWAYSRWGATKKEAALADEFSSMLGMQQFGSHNTVPNAFQGTVSPTMTTVSSTKGGGAQLDLASAIRATEAIASELVLENVLQRLIRTLIENSGARRGALLLGDNDGLVLEALGQVDPDLVEVGLRTPVGQATPIATTIAQYVARTEEPCVLADAAADPRFARDPYVAREKLRSVLCVPMSHQGNLRGVLYLENNKSVDVFSNERVELLQFLSAQAAVAVENARLYGEVSAAREELRRANETLENEVAERTEQLRETVAVLWAEMDLAKKIQTVLLPTTTRIGNYELAASMTPADSVGGDYYDVVKSDGHDWVLIGDVSGHGIAAGLIMMMVQTAVRTVILSSGQNTDLTPKALLALVNKSVMENLGRVGKGQYMTLTAFRMEGSCIQFSGLHQDILVYRRERRVVERVETQGTWIGLLDDIDGLLDDGTLELEPGDTLLLFTDGATELKLDGDMLGTKGLAELFQRAAHAAEAPAAIIKELMTSLQVERLEDDISLMAVRYAPTEIANRSRLVQ